MPRERDPEGDPETDPEADPEADPGNGAEKLLERVRNRPQQTVPHGFRTVLRFEIPHPPRAASRRGPMEPKA